MKLKYLVALVQLMIIPSFSEHTSYEGFKVYEINPETKIAQRRLRSMSISTLAYDFWLMPKQLGRESVAMVPPELQKGFEKLLEKFNISYTITVNDMAVLVAKERSLPIKSTRNLSQHIQFRRYYRYNFISRYLDELARKYPQLVEVMTIGQSFEKRNIKAIRISNENSFSSNSTRNTILIDAGIHGREWMGPMTALYTIHQLVVNASNRFVLNNFDWVILPVANPDGYERTHTKERFWQKTRKPTGWCVGTDMNRNFDFHWGEETGQSTNPCSKDFRGKKAFSDPETIALKALMQSLNGSCKFYLSLNSFGQYLLYPWRYEDSRPDSWKDIEEVAQEGASAIRNATGTLYTVNSFAKVLETAAGGSNDYALGVQKIPISITMILPSGGREGLRGFHPRRTKIRTIAAESWIGIKAMAMFVDRKFDACNPTEGNGTGSAVAPNGNGTDSAMAPNGNGTDSAVAPNVNGTDSAVAPNGNGTDSAVAPNGNGTDSAVAPNGNETDSPNDPNVNGTDSADAPNGDGTDSADAPNGNETDSADAPNGNETDSADAPIGDGTDSADAPNGNGTDSADVPNGDGTDSADAPNGNETDSADAPNGDETDSAIAPTEGSNTVVTTATGPEDI